MAAPDRFPEIVVEYDKDAFPTGSNSILLPDSEKPIGIYVYKADRTVKRVLTIDPKTENVKFGGYLDCGALYVGGELSLDSESFTPNTIRKMISDEMNRTREEDEIKGNIRAFCDSLESAEASSTGSYHFYFKRFFDYIEWELEADLKTGDADYSKSQWSCFLEGMPNDLLKMFLGRETYYSFDERWSHDGSEIETVYRSGRSVMPVDLDKRVMILLSAGKEASRSGFSSFHGFKGKGVINLNDAKVDPMSFEVELDKVRKRKAER